jgi:hypothetical protein
MQSANLLEQLSLLGQYPLILHSLTAACKQLAGAIQQLKHPLSQPNGMDSVIRSDLVDGHENTDRIHSGPRLVLGTVGEALAHW